MAGWSILRKEFRLVQFRLLYPNSADFAESPVSFSTEAFTFDCDDTALLSVYISILLNAKFLFKFS